MKNRRQDIGLENRGVFDMPAGKLDMIVIQKNGIIRRSRLAKKRS